MGTENSEYDVLEIDLPEYVSEYDPIAGSKSDASFSRNKEEIYRRNREIAAKIQAEQLSAEEKAKSEKRAELESIYEESEAAAVSELGYRTRFVFPVIIAVLAVIIGVLLVLSIRSSVRLKNSEAAAAAASEVIATWTAPETEAVTRAETTKVTRAETEMIITEEAAEETTEIPIEVLKTTAVREPFESDGTSLIYNTEAMSYKFEPHCQYYDNQPDHPWIVVYCTVKNLTDFEYFIIPDFSITLGELKKENVFLSFSEVSAMVNESSSRMNMFKVEQNINGEWTATTRENIAYSFGKDHLCSFKLQFSVYEYYALESFVYDPDTYTNSEYSEKTDVGFEFPFSELDAYIFEDHPDFS